MMLLLGLLQTRADHTIGGLVTLEGHEFELHALTFPSRGTDEQRGQLPGVACHPSK